MTPKQVAAYVYAQSVAALAEIEGMKAANTERESHGYALAYPEEAFMAVIDKYGLHHNALCDTFNHVNQYSNVVGLGTS